MRLTVEHADKAAPTFTSLRGGCAELMLRSGLFVAGVPRGVSHDPPGAFKVYMIEENTYSVL